ncbi:DEAD/DEAH box helicase [Brachybacterium atlanticum]|uniref:DEAD/DEAH box helicase n=1 Tax=Brachybacterium atlanticum TaxID=2911888 RepID=UPI0021E05396|nr:type ISP restriction/modification enzyme [Brachybacterium atlanticum]
MSVSIHDLLDELRVTALDQRDKGDRFERLIKAYLTTEPEWTARFENVWLWSEWPDRGALRDTGIDIVAELRDGQGLAAIQCKFYEAGRHVAKADIDSFISASAGSKWTERYVFDTAAGWGNNAEATLAGVAQRIDVSLLDDARVDWSKYSWTRPEQIELATAHQPRRHQKAAMDDVRKGLTENDRGKLIMACGTGKTFTSLKIAEDLVGEGGTVLFLVPSLQLLSQSLREWMAQSELNIRPFAVCSDVRVGRKADDSGDLSTVDLTEPATTNPSVLVERMRVGRRAKGRMTVVFSTYQSIDVISQAQKLGLGDFDLVICDEAHRTTGVTLAGQDESHFVKVHDEAFLRARKRLYMTATPRVFDDAVSKKAVENNAELANMADETKYGPELHRLGFGQAVEQNLLTDYKVIVLTIDEKYVAEHFQTTMAQNGEIKLNDAAKLLGCWQGLAKNFGDTEPVDDPSSMRRAVAFAKDIKTSSTAAQAFPALIERALEDETRQVNNDLRIESKHVDGTMSIHRRNEDLDWLKKDHGDDTCRVLTNARCLSEGVDVPALDAVMFLSPRNSQVDVVQSVGRVMRKDPTGAKKLGYIILPVVIPATQTPSEALNDNKNFKVVWQVLQALRSHDDRFNAMVNQIDLNKKKPDKIGIFDGTPRPTDDGSSGDGTDKPVPPDHEQMSFDLGFDTFRDAMYARIVKKVGERTYWADWASDIAEIAERHITRINALLGSSAKTRERFDTFLDGLRGNLNDSITEAQAVEMLAQHMITRPVFEAMFEGYDIAAHNPVAQTMEGMLAVLDEHALASENATLEGFYDSVRRRVDGVNNAEGRQKVLVELYNNFFAKAFKKTVDKLGIVYTPVEIVDFILRSADDVLREEFGQSLSDEGVHILDGFTGTGTFMVRLLQLGLVNPHDLARKYATEMHANEFLLLAYYIAAVNIETTYADAAVDHGLEPAPFPGLVLTDTFQSYEDGDRADLSIFPVNNERIERQRKLPITVIVGNPPYSFGQGNANDDNANNSYPALDRAIRDSYVALSAATNSNRMYDSYIRAFKWAALRIQTRGIVAFVTNGGWLDSKSADGMRRSIENEFDSVYIYNLRGNMRSADWKREGGQIFGAGSQATVAITIMVKNSTRKEVKPRLLYAMLPDGLDRAQKLQHVSTIASIKGIDFDSLQPNAHGDWLEMRSDKFQSFTPTADRNADSSIFNLYCYGLNTARQAWVYSSDRASLNGQLQLLVTTYESDRQNLERGAAAQLTRDPSKIKWSRTLEKAIRRGDAIELDPGRFRHAQFRPFNRQHVYFDDVLNDQRYQLHRLFPTAATHNNGIYITAVGASKPFSALHIDAIPDLNMWGSEGGQFLPRFRYEASGTEDGMLNLHATQDARDMVDGYRRIDNISDEALLLFRQRYPYEQISKDDIFYYTYGILHAEDYRHRYAGDLRKLLPRIPMAEDFRAFANAGRRLSELHLGYESAPAHRLDGVNAEPPAGADPYDFYAVGEAKMKYGRPTPEQKGAGLKSDPTSIIFNENIRLSGIPMEAHEYRLGTKSAIDWIIERYHIKTDSVSGIVNDPNAWSREIGNPRYILDLLAQVVALSVETVSIIRSLPPTDTTEVEDSP